MRVIDRTVSPILFAEGLCFRYPTRDLFTDWSARIPPGITLLLGGDGSGKTTLLRLLAGALAADTGELQVLGTPLKQAPAAYRSEVFWVDPRSDAYERVSAAEYFKSLHKIYPRFDEPRLRELVVGLSLEPHLDKPLYMLSTGSKRKVWLAATFASDATVMLLDDPFAALDKPSIVFVVQVLKEAAHRPNRAVVVAHYEALGDVELAQTILLSD